MAKSKRRKGRSPKLTPAERERRRVQRRFSADIQNTFSRCGFHAIRSRDSKIEVDGREGELDHVFIYDKVIVIVEDTCTVDSENIKNHLNAKANFYDFIQGKQKALVDALDEKIPGFKKARPDLWDAEDLNVVFVYASRYPFAKDGRPEYKQIKFLSNEYLRYFLQLSRTIGKSAKYELFKFLGLKSKDVTVGTGDPWQDYPGFVLPDRPSGFPRSFKLVTFYIDPQTLIAVSYALRRDSWLDSDALYQRMLIRSKITQMRKFLATKGHVYVNNAIVSLPANTFISEDGGKEVDVSALTEAKAVKIRIPKEFNSIGIIDGQHRVFSYHEGNDAHESEIAKRRIKHQLLVTGVIFPASMKLDARLEKEAELFLEINDRQSRTKSELKQSIETIVSPYSDVAIGRSVVSEVAKMAPLVGFLKDHYFDDGKVKTSSIVSYALRYLVTPNPVKGSVSLIDVWDRSKAKQLRAATINGGDAVPEIRLEYVKWCATQLSRFYSAYKVGAVPSDQWTADQKVSRALTVTSLNAIIFCFRDVIAQSKLGDFDGYRASFEKLEMDFSTAHPTSYGPSEYRKLGSYIFEKCFKV